MISKRAFVAEGLKRVIKEMWRKDQGPAENVFRLVSYVPSVFGWSGMALVALDKVLSEYGYGLEDLGKWIDDNYPTQLLMSFAKEEGNMSLKVSRLEEHGLKKNAFIGTVFKKILGKFGGVKYVLKLLGKAIQLLLYALGLSKVEEIYDSIKEDKGFEDSGEEYSVNMFGGSNNYPSLDPKNYGPEGYKEPRS